MKKILQSSTGSGNLSLTVKGLLLSLVPIIITIASTQGVSLAEADLVKLINDVFAIIAGITVVAGLARKIYLSAFKK